jgi:hypothetical protein
MYTDLHSTSVPEMKGMEVQLFLVPGKKRLTNTKI